MLNLETIGLIITKQRATGLEPWTRET